MEKLEKLNRRRMFELEYYLKQVKNWRSAGRNWTSKDIVEAAARDVAKDEVV